MQFSAYLGVFLTVCRSSERPDRSLEVVTERLVRVSYSQAGSSGAVARL